MPSKENYPENELGVKLDRCFADTLLKMGGGFVIGVVSSVLFFRGRLYPVTFGTGVGIGMGWDNCRHHLNEQYVSHGKKVKIGTDQSGKPVYEIVVEAGKSNENTKKKIVDPK